MKWIDDPPTDWDSAPEEPPDVRSDVPLEAEMLIHGFVHREEGVEDDAGAYIYTSEDAVSLEDWN